jgi:hypothetical protein
VEAAYQFAQMRRLVKGLSLWRTEERLVGSWLQATSKRVEA